MRNMGIIAILVGIGVIFISIFFSSEYNSRRDLIDNIYRMEIVLDKGHKVKIGKAKAPELWQRYKDTDREKYIIKGRVAIPLKYPFSLSVLLILFGTGIVLLSKKRK